MKLTLKEVSIINRAEKSILLIRTKTLCLLGAMVIGFVAFYFGGLRAEHFAVLCFLCVIVALLLPSSGGPRYEELVGILTRVRDNVEVEKPDPIIDALSKKT